MVNKPYGGKLVYRVVAENERAKVLESIGELAQVRIDKAAALDAEKIALGAFSPLEGFMGSEEFASVLHNESLKIGLPWTIPIVLAPSSQEKSAIETIDEGSDVVLVFEEKPLAILHLEEKYEYNKKEFANRVFGTVDPSHPDVKKLENAGNLLLSGKIDLIEHLSQRDELSPQETRSVFEQRKWETVAAFQTRNPPHIAHEYIQRCALELIDGLFIHPVVGELKPDDFPPEAVVESYAYLTGNYYPSERVFLSPFSIAMRYAGPKAAVFLAIVRKNYGCTHFIVGRDMAGVGSFYGPYAAHELLRKFDLGIEPMLFRESYYCNRCRSVATEKTCAHTPENHLKISMTRLRELLSKGLRPPPEIMRPEIADLLMKYQTKVPQNESRSR